jgi:RNA polymerase sigma-70 factor (ECF subfamily)
VSASHADDDALVAAAKAGDADALRALYDRHAPRVHAVIRRVAPERSLAEDWAQETWVRAFRALPRFRGDSSFGTWILRIAMNSAAYEARRLTRRRRGERPLDPALRCPERPTEPVLRDRLERALALLPEGMRRILVLHDVEGYAHDEIARILGNRPSTCRSQLFKARARMRELLGELHSNERERSEPCPT